MIKNLFLFLAVLGMFAALSKAQVSSVTGQYLQDNNLLLNPGFESGIGKWTNGAGTFTADYSVFVQGKASGKVVLSSQVMDFYQDSTIFASQLADGMQAILTVKIKSNVAGVRVCPRQAGVLLTSLCVNVQGNDKWGLYQIPFVTGATSQGISINSNSTSITGTVYVDESYVGVSNILNSSSEAKLAGEAYFAGTTGCNWTRTSTTVGAFAAVAACPGPTIVRQNLGAWQTTDADLPRVTVNNLPAGTYKAKFMVRHVLSTSGNSAFAINDGTTTCEPQYGVTGGLAQYTGLMVECTFNYTSAGNRVFELYAGSTANAITISSDTAASPRISSKFILEYYGSNSTYTTTAGINNVDVFSAKINNNGDAVTEENVDWLPATCTDTDPGESSCTFNSGIFTTTPNCVCNISNQVGVGDCKIVATSTGFATYNSVANNYNIQVMCQKQGADFVASKTITGSFKEVGVVIGTSKPKFYSANIKCDGSSQILSQKGAVATAISNISTGVCNITLPSTTFSDFSTVQCTAVYRGGLGSGNIRSLGAELTSSTNLQIDCVQTSADCSSYFAGIICLGDSP